MMFVAMPTPARAKDDRRRPDRRALAVLPSLFLAVLLLLAVGCDSGSPTDLDGAPLVFSGVLGALEEDVHIFNVADSGIVRVTLEELSARLVDITVFDPATLVLQFNISPAADDCTGGTSFVLTRDQSLSFQLEPIEYCLRVFDSGVLPEDALVDYTVALRLPG